MLLFICFLDLFIGTLRALGSRALWMDSCNESIDRILFLLNLWISCLIWQNDGSSNCDLERDLFIKAAFVDGAVLCLCTNEQYITELLLFANDGPVDGLLESDSFCLGRGVVDMLLFCELIAGGNILGTKSFHFPLIWGTVIGFPKAIITLPSPWEWCRVLTILWGISGFDFVICLFGMTTVDFFDFDFVVRSRCIFLVLFWLNRDRLDLDFGILFITGISIWIFFSILFCVFFWFSINLVFEENAFTPFFEGDSFMDLVDVTLFLSILVLQFKLKSSDRLDFTVFSRRGGDFNRWWIGDLGDRGNFGFIDLHEFECAFEWSNDFIDLVLPPFPPKLTEVKWVELVDEKDFGVELVYGNGWCGGWMDLVLWDCLSLRVSSKGLVVCFWVLFFIVLRTFRRRGLGDNLFEDSITNFGTVLVFRDDVNFCVRFLIWRCKPIWRWMVTGGDGSRSSLFDPREKWILLLYDGDGIVTSNAELAILYPLTDVAREYAVILWHLVIHNPRVMASELLPRLWFLLWVAESFVWLETVCKASFPFSESSKIMPSTILAVVHFPIINARLLIVCDDCHLFSRTLAIQQALTKQDSWAFSHPIEIQLLSSVCMTVNAQLAGIHAHCWRTINNRTRTVHLQYHMNCHIDSEKMKRWEYVHRAIWALETITWDMKVWERFWLLFWLRKFAEKYTTYTLAHTLLFAPWPIWRRRLCSSLWCRSIMILRKRSRVHPVFSTTLPEKAAT